MRPATLVCAMAIVVDAAVVGLALAASPSPLVAVALVALHGLVSLLFACQLASLLPAPYSQPRNRAVAFIFGSIVFVPVLSMVGFLCSLLPALRRQSKESAPAAWAHPPAVSLPTQAAGARGAHAFVWAGSLAGTLQNASDPNKRIAALIATLSIQEHDAIPLWRLALKDAEDEVRLLAYSLLDRKERAIEARIRLSMDRLDATARKPGKAFELNKALAYDLWGLSQLASPRSSTQLALCARARERADLALGLAPNDGGLRLLLARILIAQRQLDEAEQALTRASEEGVDPRQVEPLLAEMAFIDRRYQAVGQHIARTGTGRSLSRIGVAAEQWKGVGHAAVSA